MRKLTRRSLRLTSPGLFPPESIYGSLPPISRRPADPGAVLACLFIPVAMTLLSERDNLAVANFRHDEMNPTTFAPNRQTHGVPQGLHVGNTLRSREIQTHR